MSPESFTPSGRANYHPNFLSASHGNIKLSNYNNYNIPMHPKKQVYFPRHFRYIIYMCIFCCQNLKHYREFEIISNICYDRFIRGDELDMNFGNLFEIFKKRCKTIQGFIRTKYGRNLFLIACAVFVLLFFAPLFQGAVGAALIGCVASELVVMIWRRHDKEHAIVPAVFFCIPMVLDMLIYHTLSIAVCMLVGIVATLAVAIHPAFDFVVKIKDPIYAYLSAGGVCAAVVAIASLLILLVSIAWWLFCLLLFLAVIAVFFTVVLSTAAYTATDAKRQARKKHNRRENEDTPMYDYDFDTFAQDIGLKNELDPESERKAYTTDVEIKSVEPAKHEKLYYDVNE